MKNYYAPSRLCGMGRTFSALYFFRKPIFTPKIFKKVKLTRRKLRCAIMVLRCGKARNKKRRRKHMNKASDFEITRFTATASLQKYCGDDEVVTVPEGVTEIAAAAFARNPKIKKVVIPEGVTWLASEVFFECPNLECVELPSTLRHIGSDCFCRCKRLKEIAFPDGVEMIGPGAFLECEALKKVKIPAALRSLNAGVFMWCYELREVFIPEGLEKINESAFRASGENGLCFTIAAGNKNFAVEGARLIDVRTGTILWEPISPTDDL